MLVPQQGFLPSDWLCPPIPAVFRFSARVPKAKHRGSTALTCPGAVAVLWGHCLPHQGSLGHVSHTSQHALSFSRAVSAQFFFSFSVLLLDSLDLTWWDAVCCTFVGETEGSLGSSGQVFLIAIGHYLQEIQC